MYVLSCSWIAIQMCQGLLYPLWPFHCHSVFFGPSLLCGVFTLLASSLSLSSLGCFSASSLSLCSLFSLLICMSTVVSQDSPTCFSTLNPKLICTKTKAYLNAASCNPSELKIRTMHSTNWLTFHTHRLHNRQAVWSVKWSRSVLYTSRLVCCCNHLDVFVTCPGVFPTWPADMWPKTGRLPVLTGSNQVRSWVFTTGWFPFKYGQFVSMACRGVTSGYLTTTGR